MACGARSWAITPIEDGAQVPEPRMFRRVMPPTCLTPIRWSGRRSVSTTLVTSRSNWPSARWTSMKGAADR